ncbi:MAG: GntR family transcriptional regulator [Desulfobacterales bacterium]|nr:GntR family transcriptional regulator [Desulfobacterales bacterium]
MEDIMAKNLSNQPGTSLLRTQVYEYLRRELRKEKLKPGMSISMNDLMRNLGISRTPLRDALLQLQNEGFVTFLPQRGIRINELTRKDIENMYQMLGALDSRVLLAVFDRIGSRELDQMKQINDEMGKNLEAQNFPRYWNLNTAFHNVYLNLSNNELILNHINILRQRLFEFGKKDWSLRRKHVIHKEHSTLIDLIEKGDGVGAADFMRDVHTILDLDAKIHQLS